MTQPQAIKTGRLQEFIAQEEKRGVGPADLKKLEKAIKQGVSKDQTSRSSSRGGSSEK